MESEKILRKQNFLLQLQHLEQLIHGGRFEAGLLRDRPDQIRVALLQGLAMGGAPYDQIKKNSHP